MKEKCDVCSREFQSKAAVNMHKMRAHRGMTNKPKRGLKRKVRKGVFRIEANYCPKCGCNLEAIRAALELTS